MDAVVFMERDENTMLFLVHASNVFIIQNRCVICPTRLSVCFFVTQSCREGVKPPLKRFGEDLEPVACDGASLCEVVEAFHLHHVFNRFSLFKHDLAGRRGPYNAQKKSRSDHVGSLVSNHLSTPGLEGPSGTKIRKNVGVFLIPQYLETGFVRRQVLMSMWKTQWKRQAVKEAD